MWKQITVMVGVAMALAVTGCKNDPKPAAPTTAPAAATTTPPKPSVTAVPAPTTKPAVELPAITGITPTTGPAPTTVPSLGAIPPRIAGSVPATRGSATGSLPPTTRPAGAPPIEFNK